MRTDTVEHGTDLDRGSAAWVFQGNPRHWRIDDFLGDVRGGRVDPRVPWLVTRYARRIAEGDRVYLWRAGAEAGVVALARVVGAPRSRPDDKTEYRTADSERFVGDRMRAILEVDALLDTSLSRSGLRSDPLFEDMAILRFPYATNFARALCRCQISRLAAERLDGDAPDLAREADLLSGQMLRLRIRVEQRLGEGLSPG